MTIEAPATGRRTVVVVGGGITGLAAAWELSGGAGGPGPRTPRVVLLEGDATCGGKMASVPFGEGPVDLGADGFLGRRPEAVTLCREVELDDQLEPIGASGAAVWARQRRRTLPAGLVLGVPTRFRPLRRSGILGPGGTLRALADLWAPRPADRGPLGDRAIGPLVARKLGGSVVSMLVDPLVGGIHAGPVSDMSAAAVFPLLLESSQGRGSLMRALRKAAGPPGGTRAAAAGPPGETRSAAAGGPAADAGARTDTEAVPPTEPLFWSLQAGMRSLPDQLVTRLAARGVKIHTGVNVLAFERSDDGHTTWSVRTTGPSAGGATMAADAIVVTTPAPVTAGLLEPHDAEAATLLRGIDHASVAVVTFRLPPDALPTSLEGTGLLVPHGTQSPLGDEPLLVTACTYLSAKWPHLRRPDEVLLRASVGRYADDRPATLDDDALTARVVDELRLLVDLQGTPKASMVTRWTDAFPQYRVHHLLRVSGIEAAVRRLPLVAVAGAAYRGVGIPACVGSGRSAARAILDALQELPAGAVRQQ